MNAISFHNWGKKQIDKNIQIGIQAILEYSGSSTSLNDLNYVNLELPLKKNYIKHEIKQYIDNIIYCSMQFRFNFKNENIANKFNNENIKISLYFFDNNDWTQFLPNESNLYITNSLLVTDFFNLNNNKFSELFNSGNPIQMKVVATNPLFSFEYLMYKKF